MIQPQDIKNQTFKKGIFGYKPADVDTFVSTVSRAYEDAFNENAKLKADLEAAKKAQEELRVQVFELENKLKEAEARLVEEAEADDSAADTSAASKFFKQQEEATASAGEDDEIFVGEIEDNRKSNKVMIGDGDDGTGDDFEFL